MTEPNQDDPVTLEDAEDDLPRYDEVGRILVNIIDLNPCGMCKHEYEVLDYDNCVFWINEGVGLEYWLDEYCEFISTGFYVIEGIKGECIRGDWTCGEDDNEVWEFKKIRQATDEEIKTCLLKDYDRAKR